VWNSVGIFLSHSSSVLVFLVLISLVSVSLGAAGSISTVTLLVGSVLSEI